jgi:hypothetical protein
LDSHLHLLYLLLLSGKAGVAGEELKKNALRGWGSEEGKGEWRFFLQIMNVLVFLYKENPDFR